MLQEAELWKEEGEVGTGEEEGLEQETIPGDWVADIAGGTSHGRELP